MWAGTQNNVCDIDFGVNENKVAFIARRQRREAQRHCTDRRAGSRQEGVRRRVWKKRLFFSDIARDGWSSDGVPVWR